MTPTRNGKAVNDDPDVALTHAMRAISHRMRKLAARRLAPIGLHPGQEVVLLALAARGPLNQVQMADELEIEQPSVTGIVTKLEAGGFLTRTVSGRERVLRLTPKGEAAAAASLDAYREMDRELRAALPDGAAQSLAWLTAITDRLTELLDTP